MDQNKKSLRELRKEAQGDYEKLPKTSSVKRMNWVALALSLICCVMWFAAPAYRMSSYFGDSEELTQIEYVRGIRALDDLAGDLFGTASTGDKPMQYYIALLLIFGLVVCSITSLLRLNLFTAILSIGLECLLGYQLIASMENASFDPIWGYWVTMVLILMMILSYFGYACKSVDAVDVT